MKAITNSTSPALNSKRLSRGPEELYHSVLEGESGFILLLYKALLTSVLGEALSRLCQNQLRSLLKLQISILPLLEIPGKGSLRICILISIFVWFWCVVKNRKHCSSENQYCWSFFKSGMVERMYLRCHTRCGPDSLEAQECEADDYIQDPDLPLTNMLRGLSDSHF